MSRLPGGLRRDIDLSALHALEEPSPAWRFFAWQLFAASPRDFRDATRNAPWTPSVAAGCTTPTGRPKSAASRPVLAA